MKVKKLLTLLLAMALVLVGFSTSVFAEDEEEKKEETKSAYLVKIVKQAKNLKYEGSFTFQFEALEDSTHTDPKDKVNFDVPAIANQTISISASSSAVADRGDDSNDVYAELELYSVLNAVKGGWPHAGKFVYKVTEVKGSDENITYSTEAYQLEVWIKNSKDGKSTVVDNVVVKPIEKKDDGSETVGNNKVDPTVTPGDKKDDKGDDDDKKSSSSSSSSESQEAKGGFYFTNVYSKETTLTVSKTVEGKYADKTYQFDFSLTINLPSSNSKTPTVKKGDTAVEANEDGTYSFKLCDGESVTVSDLAIGADYTVVETKFTEYTTTATVSESTDSSTDDGDKAYTVKAKAADAKNAVAFNNKLDKSPETGIVMDNLPIIVMIIVAAAGIVLYVRRNSLAKK